MPIFSDVVVTDPETGKPSDSGSPDFTSVKERIFGTRRKSSKRKSSDTEDPMPSEKELEKIFAGENWEEVSALYFNSRFAITGWNGFLLTDAQKKTLGLSLGTTMKLLLKIDPGYVALIVFTANFGGLIAQKEVIYKKLLQQEEKLRGNDKSHPS